MRLINSFGSFYSHVLLEHTHIIDHALLPFHVSCFMIHDDDNDIRNEACFGTIFHILSLI